MSDNGYQKMSVVFMKTCARLAITQAFTSYNNPTGSADTEWLMRTLKEELLWHREWTSLRELERALAAWVDWLVQQEVFTFGGRVLDAVSGRTTTSQPQSSVRGCLTNRNLYIMPRPMKAFDWS
jgi:hypothetical protein